MGLFILTSQMFLLPLKHKMLFVSFSNHAGELKFTHILKFTSSSSQFFLSFLFTFIFILFQYNL